MCVEHVWQFRNCHHSQRSRTYCAEARREKKKAESGCCGLFSSAPRKVCNVEYDTRYSPRPCRTCQKVERDRADQEARRTAEARAQARQAAQRYGWDAPTVRGGGNAGNRGGAHRDSYISSALYRQAVMVAPEREYRQFMPPPVIDRPANSRVPTPRATARDGSTKTVPAPPAPAVVRGRRGPEGRAAGSGSRDAYRDIVRSAGFPFPLPEQRHESADEFGEPLPDDDFLDMVGRLGNPTSRQTSGPGKGRR